MITVSKEDYLKAILEAECEGTTVISATLAHWLKVSPPAVTMALRRLKKDGFVRVQNGGNVRLTAAGRKIARRLTLRHHLIERMLSEMFGMEWYKVHDEAERLEHAVSADFEEKLIAKLGANGICPHGNDIRGDGVADRRARGLVLLHELKPGARATIESVFERDRALLEYFDGRGLRPGVPIHVMQLNPDDTIQLQAGTSAALLGGSAASKIWVRPIDSVRD